MIKLISLIPLSHHYLNCLERQAAKRGMVAAASRMTERSVLYRR